LRLLGFLETSISEPSHIVFAGEKHIRGYLERAGFDVVKVQAERVDTASDFVKNVAKILLGRPFLLRMPYTSRYRQLLVRARLR
jgi:hypothetical protein